EAVFGVEKELEFTRMDRCGVCAGTGALSAEDRVVCPDCDGAGETRRAQQSVFGQFVNVTPCTRCNGDGRIIKNPCVTCQGAGRVKATRKITVTIPAGIDDGQQIRLTGEGEAGPNGGEIGNLYVVVTVAEHPQFQ